MSNINYADKHDKHFRCHTAFCENGDVYYQIEYVKFADYGEWLCNGKLYYHCIEEIQQKFKYCTKPIIYNGKNISIYKDPYYPFKPVYNINDITETVCNAE